MSTLAQASAFVRQSGREKRKQIFYTSETIEHNSVRAELNKDNEWKLK